MGASVGRARGAGCRLAQGRCREDGAGDEYVGIGPDDGAVVVMPLSPSAVHLQIGGSGTQFMRCDVPQAITPAYRDGLDVVRGMLVRARCTGRGRYRGRGLPRGCRQGLLVRHGCGGGREPTRVWEGGGRIHRGRPRCGDVGCREWLDGGTRRGPGPWRQQQVDSQD
ncbi:hypothetical protein ACFFX0_07110 [Citricoccus parietis]|uniref:Uncharacterized protein n=1 Tax=Citricoccus parietis TaxID=592307 RepID=A0ABV5FWB4_9MICC